MSKETDEFLKYLKKNEKLIGLLNKGGMEKLKKSMIAQLDKTWSAEDVAQEAVQKVRLSGVTGKKTASFIKEGDVPKTLNVWRGELAKHQGNLKDFKAHCDEAKTLHAELKKRVDAIEKHLKKSGGTGDIKVMAAVKSAKRSLPELQATSKMMGTLQAPVIMYGTNMKRSLDGIVKMALEGVDPKEFPKAFEGDNRKKTDKLIKKNDNKIKKLCTKGEKEIKGGNRKGAEKIVKEVKALVAELEALADEGKKVEKTMKKEIKDAADGKEVQALIKLAAAKKKAAVAKFDALEDAFDEMPDEG